MAITNLLIQVPPLDLPEYMRGKFFELYEPSDEDEDKYVGWVWIREDGTIEFGEPGA